MESKIQELTNKIYSEGVEKGKEEAARLIESAKAEALQTIEKANKEAEAIVAAAKKSAGELQDHTQSELKLFANQTVNALKTEIANLISDKLVKASVKDLMGDKQAINQFILAIAQQWSASEPIVIDAANAEALKSYFQAQAKELLNKGVTINQVNGQKTAFSISPADGSYKVNFGEAEFENYFKAFLRPQLVDMLF